MIRLLPLLLALLLPVVAHADAPPLVEDAPPVEAAPTPPENPEWRAPLIKDMQHHLGVWGVSTALVGGLETGFLLAGTTSPPGWFQGATVNLAFLGLGLSGFVANGLVLQALKTTPNRPAFAHHTRRAAIGAMIFFSSFLHVTAVHFLPVLSWQGWSPEAFALMAAPLGALSVGITLTYWSARADQAGPKKGHARRPQVELVAAGPTGLVLRF